MALLSPVAGRIVDKHGPKGSLIGGLVLLLCSAFLQSHFNTHTTIALLLVAYGLFGIGWACILSPSLTAAMVSVPPNRSGVAAGMMGTSHNLGGALGLALGSLIFTYGTKLNLLTTLQKLQLPIHHWVDDVVMNTDQAIVLLAEHTPLTLETATQVFKQAFLSGYQNALWFLAILMIAALVVSVILRKKKMVAMGGVEPPTSAL